MANSIYKKSFVFEATRYEEYSNGRCIGRGVTNTQIVAKVMSADCIGFALLDEVPTHIKQHFGLPIFGIGRGDILSDRIQYGRLPDADKTGWFSSDEPVVCNIFNNMTCIRFAMLSPLRIVEFYGRFTDIRDL